RRSAAAPVRVDERNRESASVPGAPGGGVAEVVRTHQAAAPLLCAVGLEARDKRIPVAVGRPVDDVARREVSVGPRADLVWIGKRRDEPAGSWRTLVRGSLVVGAGKRDRVVPAALHLPGGVARVARTGMRVALVLRMHQGVDRLAVTGVRCADPGLVLEGR